MKLFFLVIAVLVYVTHGWQNLFPVFSQTSIGKPRSPKVVELEEQLLKAIDELGDERLANSKKVNSLISELERSDESIHRKNLSFEVVHVAPLRCCHFKR